MDNQPRGAEDLPDPAELSGPLREAVEQIRREAPPEAMLARVLDRARQIAATTATPPATADLALPLNKKNHSSARRHRMFTIATRAAAAIVAASLVVGAWLASRVSSTEAADFGAVLAKTSSAKTLQLKLTRDGKTSEVWVRGRQLRCNLPDGTYQVARDGKAWLVDEKANRASSRTAAYFQGDTGGVDLLALLDLPPETKRKELLAARPTGRETRDGREVDVYRWETTGQDARVQIDAVVDAKTQVLRSIQSLRIRDKQPEPWPVCNLVLVARDKPVNEDLFVVGDTLTEDGRIGKVTDVQGLVTIRPVMAQRWSPVVERMPIRLGDWFQTDPRGANAVSVRLVKETDLVLGPGSTVELSTPRRIRISSGEIRIKAPARSPVELIGPDGKKVAVEGTRLYRADGHKLVTLGKEPAWLRGYEGKTANDSIGSLVTNIDGRNVPLTVGYHKVTVDVRDQIARTTIEESFVNHTNVQLEGTFFFPLPQDASIAGFGMWIGDRLVEADIVEKQRAREIYEEILREKRDPGLLEWSGGNIFKARVFPILPQSEKRITITYTQVLPMRGNAYRYQYALQSELLKEHPLRQLEIDVKINSALPLRSVSSPTHLTRNALTAHSAHVEFSAKEYTPTQDFEVVVEAGGRQSDVVLIPHRRGEDGYFLLQLTPPGDYADLRPAKDGPSAAAGQTAPEGQLQREVLPDGQPVELLLLADTSASMDGPSRERQAELVAALLAALTPKDTFNLATCDVACDWVFARPASAEPNHVDEARRSPRRPPVVGMDRPRSGRCLRPGAVRAEDPGRLRRRRHRDHRRRRSGGLRQAAAPAGRGQAGHVPRRGRQQQLRAGCAPGHRLAGRRVVPRSERLPRTRGRRHGTAGRNHPAGTARLEGRVRGPADRPGLSRSVAQPPAGHAADHPRPLHAAGRGPVGRGGRHRHAGRQAGPVHGQGFAEGRRVGQLVHPAAYGPACTSTPCWSKALRRPSRTRSSPCRKSTTSSPRTRRSWSWRAMPTARRSA